MNKCRITLLVLVSTHPFLSIGISQIVDSLRVPHLPDAEQLERQETVLSHDDEVHEEAGSGLDHTDLPVGHRDQPVNTRTCVSPSRGELSKA